MPAEFERWFIEKKTETFLSVSKLATSGSLIFPKEILHDKQQRLKRKDYEI